MVKGKKRGAGFVKLFRERAEAAGAEVLTSATPAAARTAIASILEEHGPQTIASAADAKAFVPAKFRARFVRGDRAEDSAAAEAGIVLAHFGIAETGTLVHLDRTDAEKNVWTLPPICVAVLDACAIVGRFEDVLPAITRHLASPSGFGQVSLVTGPSRTADIENVLSIGVHGPGRLVIVLIDPFADATPPRRRGLKSEPRLSRRGREARLRANPEQAPAFMPGSRGVDAAIEKKV